MLIGTPMGKRWNYLKISILLKHTLIKQFLFHEEEQNKDNPFFSYIAFQAIHTPVQAPREFVDHYLKIYSKGWDEMRQNRFEKAKQLGLIPEGAQLNENIPNAKKWD